MLVGAYSRTGDTILDLTCDPTIEGAAGAGARRYLPIPNDTDLTDLSRPPGVVGLIVLRWPTDADPLTHATAVGLFAACRLLLSDDGHTVVVLAVPVDSGRYVDHAEVLMLRPAGFVVVTAQPADRHSGWTATVRSLRRTF